MATSWIISNSLKSCFAGASIGFGVYQIVESAGGGARISPPRTIARAAFINSGLLLFIFLTYHCPVDMGWRSALTADTFLRYILYVLSVANYKAVNLVKIIPKWAERNLLIGSAILIAVMSSSYVAIMILDKLWLNGIRNIGTALVICYEAGYILYCMSNLRRMVMKSEENMLVRLGTLTPKSARSMQHQNQVKGKIEDGMNEKGKCQEDDDCKVMGKGTTSLVVGSLRTTTSEDNDHVTATKRAAAKDDNNNVDGGPKTLKNQHDQHNYSNTELLSSVAQAGVSKWSNISQSPADKVENVKNVLFTQNESFCSTDDTIAPISLVQSIAETTSGASALMFHRFNQQKITMELQYSVSNVAINPIAQNDQKSDLEAPSALNHNAYSSTEGKTSNNGGKHNPLFWMMSKHNFRSSHSERLSDHQKIKKMWFTVVKTKLTRLIVSGALIASFIVGILLFITSNHLQNRKQSWSKSYDAERDSYNIGTDIGFWGMLLINCYMQFYSAYRKPSPRSNVPALIPSPG
eukprot:jgi/Bigna1/84768/estExt_fgenesh1_pg.C_10014